MNTERTTGKEDNPAAYNAEAVNTPPPAKIDHAQHKIDIDQSDLGRAQGQSPADEHIESRISQIDNASADKYMGSKMESEANDDVTDSENANTTGYMNDAVSADRDTGTGTDNWDENSSRTARHK